MRRRHWLADLLAIGLHAPALVGASGARRESQVTHRSDAGQGLTPKTHAANRLKIIQRGDFAGRMALHCQREFCAGYTLAVVTHPDQASAALLDLNLDSPCPGIKTVFCQFLDHRRRPLDDLARSDLVNQFER